MSLGSKFCSFLRKIGPRLIQSTGEVFFLYSRALFHNFMQAFFHSPHRFDDPVLTLFVAQIGLTSILDYSLFFLAQR